MRPVLLLSCLAFVACTEFPDLDGTLSPEAQDAPFPALVPVEPLLAQADGFAASPSAGPAVIADMNARISALMARAARLRGPVIPPAVKARMLRGVPSIALQ